MPRVIYTVRPVFNIRGIKSYYGGHDTTDNEFDLGVYGGSLHKSRQVLDFWYASRLFELPII